ncbi:MAG: hypothetical protein H6993_01050 [Pseudomonadales bacterium]|nr:hypothetical protein [Pseudomonadales bacterium]MCP5182511.1 hypothetical protein [Pseudomonadales bacterium]
MASAVPGLVFLLLLSFTPIAEADGRIGIPAEVPFHPDTTVPEKVKAECDLGGKVATFITKYNSNVVFSTEPENGQYVEMAITEAFAPGGGAWSGPKWMEVTGTLNNNGEKVASFRAKRFSTGGAFAGFKGTCSIIGRCTKALGKDIAEWLRNPVDGAELGDAR